MIPSMQLIKYLGVGLLNTFVGYGVFFILVRSTNIAPEIANGAGYFLALVVAFLLNRLYVFKASGATLVLVKKFAYAFFFSFLLNQIILVVSFRIFKFTPEIAQIPAMITYTIMFYVLNKYYVFSAAEVSK